MPLRQRHPPSDTTVPSQLDVQNPEERQKLLRSTPADRVDRDIDLLQRMSRLSGSRKASQNAQSMIEAYLEADDRFFTKETIIREGLFMLGEKAQSTLRDLHKSSHWVLQDAMGTDFELFNNFRREHKESFARFDPLSLISDHFSLTTELESLSHIIQHVDTFFQSLQVTHTKLENVLQQYEDRGRERPMSAFVMVLGLHIVLEDYQNVGTWYLDGLQDCIKHAIQGDLVEGTPHDDLTRDVDVHRKVVELEHPPSLVFNHMIRIKKILLERDAQFFIKEKRMRHAHRVLLLLRTSALLKSQLEQQVHEGLSTAITASLDKLDEIFDAFNDQIMIFEPECLLGPTVALLLQLRNPLNLPVVHGCLDEFMEELKRISSLLRRLQVECPIEGYDAVQVKEHWAKYIRMLSQQRRDLCSMIV